MPNPFIAATGLRGPERRRFVRHYLEMVVAMVAGMIVLAPLWHPLARWLGRPELLTRPELHTLVMATDMTVAMSLWMLWQGHGWRPILEMAAAMYAPFVLLFGPLWAGLISAGTLMSLGHALMLVAMLVVMLLRPDEYTGCHRAQAAAEPATAGPGPAGSAPATGVQRHQELPAAGLDARGDR